MTGPQAATQWSWALVGPGPAQKKLQAAQLAYARALGAAERARSALAAKEASLAAAVAAAREEEHGPHA